MAATANFRDVIAAQDAALKKEKNSKKKSLSVMGWSGNANKRIVTYNNGVAGASSQRPKKVKLQGTGYRLSDGKEHAGSPSKNRGKLKEGAQKPLFESTDDVASTLLSSLNGSGNSKGGNKFLRMAMRGAVAKSYEASHAQTRVAAVSRGDFRFEERGDHNGSGDVITLGRSTLYTVTYSKGIEGRGKYEEQVEIIGVDALKGVLELVYNTPPSNDADSESDGEDKHAYGKEMLRPVSIAQMSPRVFWSLVGHSCNALNKDQSSRAPSSVEDMLQTMMPHLDWTHLGRGGRKRQLSEKARDNLRQKRQGVAQPMTNSSSQVGVKAIEEMEQSIMNAVMPDKGDDSLVLNERERRANAALARLGKAEAADLLPASRPANHGIVDEWMLVTPIEDDIEELIECIMEARSCKSEDQTSKDYDEEAAKEWAGALLDNVRNWRELANCNAEYILSKLKQGAHTDAVVPTSDTVQKWIDYAQVQSLEEIMLEIFDCDQDALDLLHDKAKSSCPRDLSNWQSAPRMLIDVMVSGMEGPCKKWGTADAIRWTRRAKTALSVCTWLELFTTACVLDS